MDICDTFFKEGKELKIFLKTVERLAENTYVLEMETNKMELLPVLDMKRVARELLADEKKIRKQDLTQGKKIYMGTIRDYFSKTLPTLQTLSLEEVLEKGGDEAIFWEAKRESRLFIRYEGQMYFTSPRLSESLCARVKMYGDAVYDTSVEWAAFVTHRLHNTSQPVKALIRTIPGSGIRKIMLLGSVHYKYIPQTFFKQTIYMLEKYLGEEVIGRNWRVDAFVSTIYLEFPQLGRKLRKTYQIAEELIPGICLMTSDTYDASLSAKPTWRWGNAIMEGKGVLIEHDSKASVSMLHTRIKSDIIGQYSVFLERLKHFKEIKIVNSEAVLSHLFSQLKIMKAIGKKRTIRILPEKAIQFQENGYSAYDLILKLLLLTEDYTLPESPTKKLRRAVYDAVFLEERHYRKNAGGDSRLSHEKGDII